MRNKSNLIRRKKQMDLFDWDPAAKANCPDTEDEICTIERERDAKASANREIRNAKRLGYKEWRRIVAKHMWDDWCVNIDEAICSWEVIDENGLRATHKNGKSPINFVGELAADCDWIDFGPWR
jgi:hypothetical protein